jgi:hypothetical protein
MAVVGLPDYLDKQYISFKVTELRYMTNTFHVVRDQQSKYILVLSNVVTYEQNALRSTDYVVPATNVSVFSLRPAIRRSQNCIVLNAL